MIFPCDARTACKQVWNEKVATTASTNNGSLPYRKHRQCRRKQKTESSLPKIAPCASCLSGEVTSYRRGFSNVSHWPSILHPTIRWTFKAFGHTRVSVLDGGFLKWKMEQRRVESGRFEHPTKASMTISGSVDHARSVCSDLISSSLAGELCCLLPTGVGANAGANVAECARTQAVGRCEASRKVSLSPR